MLEIFHTKDGSPTIRNSELDITYHSRYGALPESKHVFIDAGFNYAHGVFGSELRILEIGFGSGLNALLTLAESEKRGIHTAYTSIEKFPLKEELWRNLNFNTEKNEYLLKLHECGWEEKENINEHFYLEKIEMDAMEFTTSQKFHCIYFDAFAPSQEERLWSAEMFRKLFGMMEQKACLVTFCAKGSVKRTLKECGFEVERLPGAPGKREMTRAIRAGK